MLNLGIRGHDLGKGSVEELAERAGKKKVTAIQLALAKALTGISTETGCLSPGMAYYIRNTLYKQGVQIAVLGCYINLAHPDKEERRKSLERFKEHIRYAREFGCSIVGTETGSLNADFSYHEDNHGDEAFQIVAESVKELVKEAEKFGVFVGIEGVEKYIINSPQKMKKLIDEVNSNNMQVILDPVNFLSINNYEKQDEIIQEAFDLFGDRIVILHAKDFIVKNGAVRSVPAGKGMLNYDLIMKLLKAKKPYINVLMEDTTEPFIDETMEFLKGVYERA